VKQNNTSNRIGKCLASPKSLQSGAGNTATDINIVPGWVTSRAQVSAEAAENF